MRRIGDRAVTIGLALALVGCGATTEGGSESGGTPTPAVSPGTSSLPIGKSVIPLEPGSYLSPSGFRPALRLRVSRSWTSTHRDVDGFDLSRPDPQRDAPAVAVVFLRPPGDDADVVVAQLLANVKDVGAAVTTRRATLDGCPATVMDVRRGSGQLIAGREGGIALDAMPNARLRIMVVRAPGAVLAAVTLVPRGEAWSRWWPSARALLHDVSFAGRAVD